MSENKEMLALVNVIESFVIHSHKQSSLANKRMDDIVDIQRETSKQVGKLATIMEVGEIRHNEHSNGLERLANQQLADKKAFEEHKALIDEKVTNLEKFNIAIKIKSEGVSKWMDKIDARKAAIWTGIITTVLGALILLFFGFK